MNSLRRFCHWGPITILGIFKFVSGVSIYFNSQWWPPANSIGGALNSLIFFGLTSTALIKFFTSVFNGPGFVPLGWNPVDKDIKSLQFCNICLGYKAPRSHHCKKCNRCVLKMDHHCPWINNCVGHENHGHFTLFIFFSVVACIHSTIIVSATMCKALSQGLYTHEGFYVQPFINLGLFGFTFGAFSLGLSIGVILSVGTLFYFQLRSILRNRTGIEEWIVEKAHHRRLVAEAKGEKMKPFIYPYDLGTWENIKQVLNWQMVPIGDGITWKISHSGCDQYTLTREQIEQKNEKRERSKLYSVNKKYSGRWCPVVFGFATLCNLPLTDEQRLPLSVGDYVLVTRWRKHWLFGEIPDQRNNSRSKKGWFPRVCATEVTGGMGDSLLDQKKEA